MTPQEKRWAYLIPLITLGVVLLPLLVSLLGIAIGINLFDGVVISATLFFVVCGLTVFAIPCIPLFIRIKKKQKNTLTPERNIFLLVLSVFLFVVSLVIAFMTYIGPLLLDWPPCPVVDGICWAGMLVPYAVHALFFFGFGVIGVASLPYLWFVVRDFPLKKNRRD